MFKIETASEKDIPAIIDIAEKTWWPAYSSILTAEQIRYMLDAIYAPEMLRSQIINNDQTYLVLRDQSGSQGFASYAPRGDNAEVYKIHKLYVCPQDQKRGYGQALMEEIRKRLREMNIRVVELNVNRLNPSRTFYEKFGFRILREEDIPIGPYWMNDFVMRLEI